MKGGCLITTGQLAKVREIRTYQALLFDFYPASIPALDGETIGKTILDAGLTEYICRRHKEEHSFLFRVDVRGQKDIVKKNQLAKELSTYLQENSRGMLINESSFYEVEIRVIVGGQSSRVFLRLTCMPDERFRYRKYATATVKGGDDRALCEALSETGGQYSGSILWNGDAFDRKSLRRAI